jgi:hypothetical protein
MGDTEDQAALGVKHVLRPFQGAPLVYEGQPSNGWMMLTEGDALDEMAGQPGYPAELLAGLRVPMGARLQIWLPHIYTKQGTPSNVQTYNYSICYRLRNLLEFQTDPTRGPWHSANSVGVTDTTPGTGGPRVLKPAGYRSVVVQGTAPSPPPDQTRIVMSAYPSDVTPFAGNPPAGFPLAPDGNMGIIQSGVLDPNGLLGIQPAASPLFDIINDVALGDELLIGVWRPQIAAAMTWDFNNADGNFFTAFTSSPNVGVYVFIGKVPSGQNSYP